jgi:hypothetical protein
MKVESEEAVGLTPDDECQRKGVIGGQRFLAKRLIIEEIEIARKRFLWCDDRLCRQPVLQGFELGVDLL